MKNAIFIIMFFLTVNSVFTQSTNNNNGRDNSNQESLEDAILRYTEEIKRNPNNADLYFKRGYAYAFRHVIAKNTNVPPLHELQEEIIGLFNSGTDNWSKAISDWKAALRIYPNHSNARKYLERFR